jgi:hypothetical protein
MDKSSDNLIKRSPFETYYLSTGYEQGRGVSVCGFRAVNLTAYGVFHFIGTGSGSVETIYY